MVGNVGTRFLERKKDVWNKIGEIRFSCIDFEGNARPVDCFSKAGAYFTHNANEQNTGGN